MELTENPSPDSSDWAWEVFKSLQPVHYLLPIPSLFYTLHNYNLMSLVANQSPHKSTRFYRNIFVYTICVVAISSTIVLAILKATFQEGVGVPFGEYG